MSYIQCTKCGEIFDGIVPAYHDCPSGGSGYFMAERPLTNEPPVKDIDHRDDCRNVTGSDGGERPTTFTPPVKPEVDETGEEVKQYTTRIAALEDCVKDLREIAEGVDLSEEYYTPKEASEITDLLTRSKNLVP